MNKFSKTCYPRQINHNNFVKSVQQRRQNALHGHNYVQRQTPQQTHNNMQQPLQNLIEKKLQIDPTLLFNGRKNGRNTGARNLGDRSKKVQQKQLTSTSNDGFYKPSKERPQSKQQSRTKLMKNLSLNKRDCQILVQRPQTSKGQRNVVYNREDSSFRKKSLGNEEQESFVVVKRSIKTATGSGRNNNSKQLEFKTSIDPQFLALFAS